MTDDSSAPDRQRHETLEADQVSDWLSRHPDFFEGREALLASMQISHPQTGGAVSLVERLIATLRARTEQAEGQRQAILNAARQFDQQAGAMRALTLSLLQADSPDALVQTLTAELNERFNVHHLALWRQLPPGEWIQPPTYRLDDDTDQWLAARSHSASLDSADATRLLPGAPLHQGGRCSISRLALGERHGYLVLACRGETALPWIMEADNMAYLGEVMARLLLRTAS
ncbi:hypothetical protein GCM10010082_16890 [Kushneria pakistanensis]|uniref:DUF484 domain-containing protein n=1 Tax=Kushneria pakistanensis TaxID=1508770 RepID=A0ABQ3FHN4_9GAMM|nr:DUF484 family protein [Kushneria pakistanensis]GHC24815.1 hypothetical protein GCM10010082_16890 [Kushneria pakistanensis]